MPAGNALIAQSATRIGVDRVGGGGGLPNAGNTFSEIFDTLGSNFIPFINSVAILAIVLAGVTLVVSQDEDRLSKTRKIIIAILFGLVIVNVADVLHDGYLDAFFAESSIPGQGDITIIKDEVLGVLDFLMTPAAIIAIIVIIVSGIRAIAKLGGEEGTALLRRTIFATGFGIVLLIAKTALSFAVVGDTESAPGGDPSKIVQTMVEIGKAFVVLMGLAAVAIIVLAGIFMIVNVGNQEQYDRAKKLILRVVIGLIIMLVAAGLAGLVIEEVLL